VVSIRGRGEIAFVGFVPPGPGGGGGLRATSASKECLGEIPCDELDESDVRESWRRGRARPYTPGGGDVAGVMPKSGVGGLISGDDAISKMVELGASEDAMEAMEAFETVEALRARLDAGGGGGGACFLARARSLTV
jgi:hypothetical protein